MAVVDGPLFGSDAWGRIKDTIVFFNRYGWHRVIAVLGSRKVGGGDQAAWREKYKAGCAEWMALSPGEKALYEVEAGELTTGFNAWMHRWLLDLGPIEVMTLSDTVVTETSYGQGALAGVAETASRGDHTHGTPASQGAPGPCIELNANAYFSAVGGGFTKGVGATYDMGMMIYTSAGVNGDYTSYGVWVVPGTYALVLSGRTSNVSGKVDVMVGAEKIGTIDLYSAGTVLNVRFFPAGAAITSSGLQTLKLLVNGKNASSGGYCVGYHWLYLYRSA